MYGSPLIIRHWPKNGQKHPQVRERLVRLRSAKDSANFCFDRLLLCGFSAGKSPTGYF